MNTRKTPDRTEAIFDITIWCAEDKLFSARSIGQKRRPPPAARSRADMLETELVRAALVVFVKLYARRADRKKPRGKS
jgi:hypothetical protein